MQTIGDNAAARLRSLVERIERLETEKRERAEDIKDIYAEAKSSGFDPKTLRKLVSDRRKEPAEVEEQEALLEVYRRALGEYASTPLGDAAMKKVAA